MAAHNHSGERPGRRGSFLTSRAGLVLLGFLVVAGTLLFTEHRAHVLGALFWLLPLACLFFHMFMHGGHGGHGGRGGHGKHGNDRSGT